MDLRLSYTESEDTFPLPAGIRERYGPFGFPETGGLTRPYVSSNLVMGLDGRTSFRELKVHAGGREVSRSKTDRWLMDFLRAHHDGLLLGASTLREETGPDGKGWDYGINDEELLQYRRDTLKLGPQRIIVLSGSGNIDFRSAPVDLAAAAQLLRREHGIRTLLCEGGSNVYGELLRKKLIDEDFRTISLQVLGSSTLPGTDRPTAYGSAGYTPETAPWFRLISLHYALPYHIFLRLRYQGPREF